MALPSLHRDLRRRSKDLDIPSRGRDNRSVESNEELQAVLTAEPTTRTLMRFVDALVGVSKHSAEQARLLRTAINRVSSARTTSEPDDAEWMLTNIEILLNRLLEEGARPGTVKTYRSRAEAVCKDFLRFRRQPLAYLQELSAESAASPVPRRTRPAPVTKSLLACPLGEGRVFQYQLPPEGLSRKDVERIAVHLWALSNDFDGRQLPIHRQLALFGHGDAEQ